MKTIAQILHNKSFPLSIEDYGMTIYYENVNGDWYSRKLDSNGYEIAFENSSGEIGYYTE